MAEARREVEVPLRRVEPWLRGFGDRHGSWTARRDEDSRGWSITALDGTRATIAEPAWLPGGGPVPELASLGSLSPSYGVLLIRRAGYAVGAFEGTDLVERKIGTRHVHGRTAAGGWSQQRYARRRAHQASDIAAAAAEHAQRILAGHPATFLATGGDRPLVKRLRARLRPPVVDVPVLLHLAVGTPDAAVLTACADRVLAVRICVDG